MKSLYGRQFLLTAGMILISFALLGTAFIGLSYQYTIRETRDSMERNADYVADFTAKVRAEGIDVRDMAYQLYVANVAHIANAFVLVTEADGELVLCSDGATIQSRAGGELSAPVHRQPAPKGGQLQRYDHSGRPVSGETLCGGHPHHGQNGEPGHRADRADHDRRGLCGGGDLGHHRAVAGVHLHLFLYRRGGTVRGFHHQLHHLPAADQPPEGDRRDRPQIRPRRVRGAGAGL